MPRMPTLFIPHGGGPCFFMAWDPPDAWHQLAAYLRGIPDALGAPPEAIVLISAHWEADTVTVQRNPAPDLVFDYYGFPDHTYRLEYPAPGAPEVAARIAGLLAASGIESRMDSQRGFDHGVFIPLKVAFPAADIPVVQVSLRADLDPAAHLAIGRALGPLRDEGILILGSGMTYHNMAALMRHRRGDGATDTRGQAFDSWLTAAVADPEARDDALIAWHRAPGARDAHPREEHLLPLHVVAGAAGGDAGTRTFGGVVLGSVQSGYRFG